MREGSITTGKVYYDTGELFFEGTYYYDTWRNLYPWKPLDLIKGVSYYRNGNKYREGTSYTIYYPEIKSKTLMSRVCAL